MFINFKKPVYSLTKKEEIRTVSIGYNKLALSKQNLIHFVYSKGKGIKSIISGRASSKLFTLSISFLCPYT